MQKGKNTNETADNTECDLDLKMETTKNDNGCQRTKSKVRFDDSAKDQNANNDFSKNADLEVPRIDTGRHFRFNRKRRGHRHEKVPIKVTSVDLRT